MAISLPADANRIRVIGATSSADGTTPVTVYADPTTHRLLVDLGGATGTVTSISQGTGILLTPNPITTTGSVALATSLQPAASLAGNSLKFLRVNVGETAVEYATVNSGLIVGTTTITSGTTTRVLYDNGGVLGEYTISGSGNVAMTTSPVFTTPNIGSATGSITGNAGTATALQTARTIGGVSFDGTANIVPQTIQSINEATDTTCFPLFISASGSQSLQPLNNTSFTFDSNAAILGSTIINAGTGFRIAGAASSNKILKANGTNFVASTETYAAPGTSGNVMTSDGTNWTSAAPVSSTPPSLMLSTIYESISRFSVTQSGGTSTVGTTGLTSAISGLSHWTSADCMVGNGDFTWYVGSPAFSTSVWLSTSLPTNGSSYVGLGNCSPAGSGHTFTTNHIGFKIVVSSGVATLSATVGNGTNETATSMGTITSGTTYDLYLVVNGTTNVSFYMRTAGGSLSSATTISTNLPGTGTTSLFSHSMSANGGNNTWSLVYVGSSYLRK